jgi:hypothetical protein
MQDTADGEPGPRRKLQRPRIGDVLGRARGVLQFSFDDRSFN